MAISTLDAQAAAAEANPTILSPLASDTTNTTPMTAPPAATAPAATGDIINNLALPPQMTQTATNLANQLYGGGMVSGLETQRNAMMQELYDYDKMLDQTYAGGSPYPAQEGYVQNPADRVDTLAAMSGLTSQAIERTASAVDTTERAYQMAISSVLDRFLDFQKLQDERDYRNKMMELERAKVYGTGGNTKTAEIQAALKAVGLTPEAFMGGVTAEAGLPGAEGGVTLTGAGGAAGRPRMTEQQLFALTYSAPEYKDLWESLYERYGSAATNMTDEKWDTAYKMQQDFIKDDISTAMTDIKNSIEEAKAAPGDPMSDQALIYAFAKVLDKRSMVTRYDSDSIENQAGLPGWMYKAYKNTFKRRALNDEQRKWIMNNLQAKLGPREAEYANLIRNYAEMAERRGIPAEYVIPVRLGEQYGLAMIQEGSPYAIEGATSTMGTAAVPTGGYKYGIPPEQQRQEEAKQGIFTTPEGGNVNMWDFVEGPGTIPKTIEEEREKMTPQPEAMNPLLNIFTGRA